MSKGPVLIELGEEDQTVSVADVPPVPEAAPKGEAMQAAVRFAARKPSRLTKWFWGLAAAVVGAFVSVGAWDFAAGLLERNSYLGWAVTGLFSAFLIVLLMIVLREVAALGRLSRVDGMRRAADTALAQNDLVAARSVVARMDALYRGREVVQPGRDRLEELARDQLDASDLLRLSERQLLGPLDNLATREVEAAARQVAAITALVPLALADVAAALTANIRMIRRIAEIYGGRSGTIGSWRLARAVLSHMVATGAVAVGDDLLEPFLGGSILSKISRRFGEGLVNGALTARVGVAAMEVCRPLPFSEAARPRIRDIIRRALSGMLGHRKSNDE